MVMFPKPTKAERIRSREAWEAELDEIKPLLWARANGRCERCDGFKPLQAHHRQGRHVPDANTLPKLAAVCSDCHREIHSSPKKSYDEGWMIRRV